MWQCRHPRGLIESIPELKLLLHELDVVYKEAKASGEPITGVSALVSANLSCCSANFEAKSDSLEPRPPALLESLPEHIQVQLMLQRTDGHQGLMRWLLAHFVDVE